MAKGARPNPRRPCSAWADDIRYVSEGPAQGRWRTSRVPYLREPMDRCTLRDPARWVMFLGSAQIAKTQMGLNILGQVLHETPTNALVVLPSQNSMRMYNRDKLEPMLTGSPELREAVADVTSRDGGGSTTTVKRGARNAQVELLSANSSADLQSRSARLVVLEELAEYPEDTDGRGHPADQAISRTLAFRKVGEKIVGISTPGVKGKCRATKEYEAGSRARFFVPCLDCGHQQHLRLAQLMWLPGHPEGAEYACEACDHRHREGDKAQMLAAGRWVHEVPELAQRRPSYHLNALYSPFTPWRDVAEASDKAAADPGKLKVFHQQMLGEAWDEAYDLPKAEVLMLRRDRWPTRQIPAGVLFLMAATDVQGNRLEWAVWGFDQAFGQWLVDWGVIEGAADQPSTWAEHDRLLDRTWRDAWGRDLKPEAWGVDTGYMSSHVYAYVRRHAARPEPRVMALDGREGWKLPPLGTPTRQAVDFAGRKLGTVALWPVGTWDIKSELAGALKLTEQGPGPEGWPPGALRFSEIVDLAWLNQLLAERFVEDPKTGKRKWDKITSRNEAWDLAVYTRALARHYTSGWTPELWEGLMAERLGPVATAQPDLSTLWAPDLRAQAEAAADARQAEIAAAAERAVSRGAPPPPPTPEERFFEGAEDYWGDA